MSEREIALDTETTGLSPFEGHKLVEIGAVELVNRIPTGRVYHQYINPQRDMPEGAYRVHGLSEEFLSGFPTFGEIAHDFVAFIGDAKLVIHNADFDMRFINHALEGENIPTVPSEQIFCTLVHARQTFPGSPASLDALCKRFNIDNSARTKHGALLDAELLAEMYLHLMGGPQEGLGFDAPKEESADTTVRLASDKPVIPPRPHTASDDELKAHEAFLSANVKDSLWNTA